MRRIFLNITALSIACFFLLGLKACSAPETQFSWKQGGPDKIWLERSTDAFCYLTRVSGDFRGYGQMVHVGLADAPTGTFWVLEGSGAVSASAECSWFKNFSSQPTVITPPWVAASVQCSIPITYPSQRPSNPSGIPCCSLNGRPVTSPDDCRNGAIPGTLYMCAAPQPQETCSKIPGSALLAPQPAACYLSGMQGKFNGAGESDIVFPPAAAAGQQPQWGLTANSQTDTETVRGSAACLQFPNSEPLNASSTQTFRWTQGQPTPTEMIPSNAGVCFLTAVGGHFAGDGEAVQVVRQGDSSSTAPYLLTGKSSQSDVYAEARCFNYENR